MAKNVRIPVKWVRDKAKGAYNKQSSCYICGSTENLELHHTSSVTLLLNAWAKKKGYDITTDEGILAVRDEFIADHKVEIYEQVFTLCNMHHVKLHSIYTKSPPLSTSSKQVSWINIQKEKHAKMAT